MMNSSRKISVRPARSAGDETMRQSLPRDLTKLTAAQVEWCVAYHAAMPLAEIRRRQELVDQQIGMAWRQRNDFALANLRVSEEILRRGAERKLLPCRRERERALSRHAAIPALCRWGGD